MSDADASVAKIEEGLAALGSSFRDAFAASETEAALRAEQARVLGKKGDLTAVLALMRDVPAASRPLVGAKVNAFKEQVEAAFAARLAALGRAARDADLAGPPVDLTLPGRLSLGRGHPHPIREAQEDLLAIFRDLGFTVATAPEVELEEYNFTKLAFPPDHPATDMQDSFWTGPEVLLRTHTSNVQVREMLVNQPPLAVCSAGPVYRRDDDVTHSPMFHQIEGFLIDENVSFAELKGVLSALWGRDAGSLSAELLPLRRAWRRARRGLCLLQAPRRHVRRLPRLRSERMARGARLRDDSSRGVSSLRHRRRALQRIRVRHGNRSGRHAALRHSQHPPALRERSSVSRAVLSAAAPIARRACDVPVRRARLIPSV